MAILNFLRNTDFHGTLMDFDAAVKIPEVYQHFNTASSEFRRSLVSGCTTQNLTLVSGQGC